MRIRRSLLLGLLAIPLSGFTLVQAQARPTPPPNLSKIEISGNVGYQFGLSTLNFVGGSVTLADNINYGGSIGVRVKPQQFIELSVNYWDTDLVVKSVAPPTNTSTGMGVTNFYLGGYQEIQRGNARPFFGFGLGATWFNPSSSSLSDDWRFSVALGGGAKIMLGEKQNIGLRLQGNLLMTFLSTSWGGYCGTGGCGLGLFGTGMADLNFTAGLVIGLGNFWE